MKTNHENPPIKRSGGRPRGKAPTAAVRFRKGQRWVRWFTLGKTYEFSLGKVSEAEAELARLEIAVALRTGDWPAWARSTPTVRRYLKEAEAATIRDSVIVRCDGLLSEYQGHLRAEVSPGWAETSLSYLRELEAVAGMPLERIGVAEAQAYLDYIVTEERPQRRRTPPGKRSAGTRNRARAACSRCFRWAVRTGRLDVNPFASTRQAPEQTTNEIVHLSRQERDAVVAAARADPEGLAVGLAVYAGLRRGEVIRCRWEHIDLARRKLRVPEAKNRRPRVVDIAGPLAEWLGETPRGERRGVVVHWQDDSVGAIHAADRLVGRLRERLPGIPPDRVRWNAFRHTFASLLVQAGVSIYKAAKWLGNRPEVAERHYAAMRPDFDPDIDRG